MVRDELIGMIRDGDYSTSTEAAEAIAPRRSAMQHLILIAFGALGPMTDEELETLHMFRQYGQTTISKRRTELYQQGILEAVGQKVNSRGRHMVVWALKREQPSTLF